MRLHPIFMIQIGSTSLEMEEFMSVDTAIRASMDSAPGHFESTIKLDEKAGNFSKDDKVVVSLGHDIHGTKDLTTVFTGKVESITNTGPKTMVVSPLTKLYNLRIDRFYNNQYAGDIVKDLAKESQIEVDTVSSGIKFPSYVINRHNSAFEHISELARLCGFDFYTTNMGKLVFKEYKASPPHIIEYGQNIIEIQLADQTPPGESVRVTGSSPAGTKGEDKYYWMTKKNVEDKASEGSDQLLIQNMAIKDSVTAKAVSDAALKRLKAATTLKVTILGDEKILLGDTVIIQNVPESSLNGEFQVREIEHIFTKSEGFTTELTCKSR
jgi:prophage tail gpP-like protein